MSDADTRAARQRPMCQPDEMVRMMRAGDIAALDRMTRCFGERLMAVGRRACGDDERAQDAMQDALLSAGHHLQDFRGEGSVEGWLIRMVTHACRRMQRGRKNDPNLHADVDEPPMPLADSDNPEAAALRGQLAGALGDALLKLPSNDRALVMLSDGEGWKGPELAQALELSQTAVRTRLSRARRRLREALDPVWSELQPD